MLQNFLLVIEKLGNFSEKIPALIKSVKKVVPNKLISLSFGERTGDSHEDFAKNLFRESRLRLTSNNSVRKKIITAVSCLVESKSDIVG